MAEWNDIGGIVYSAISVYGYVKGGYYYEEENDSRFVCSAFIDGTGSLWQ